MSGDEHGDLGPLFYFRDVDKASAKLSDGEIIVLLELTAHRNHKTGQCNPTLPKLALKCGKSERQLQRIIRGLVERGLLQRVLGRHHQAAQFTFRLAALPLVQGRHPDVTPGSTEGRHLDVTPEPSRDDIRRSSGTTSEEIRGDISGPQGRHPDVTLKRERQKEERKEEGEGETTASPPAPSTDEITSQEQGFRIADAAAKKHGRPRPTRGTKNVEAIARLLDEARETAKAAPWLTEGELLGRRLDAHYEREDDVLVKCRWALSMAFQVEVELPRPPPFPRPPVKPLEPPLPMSETEVEVKAAVYVDGLAYMGGLMRTQMTAYRNGGYQKELDAFPARLAAWESAWAAYMVERDRVKDVYTRAPEPQRNGVSSVQRPAWGWGWMHKENEERALRGEELIR
jgi:hypothetical protein